MPNLRIIQTQSMVPQGGPDNNTRGVDDVLGGVVGAVGTIANTVERLRAVQEQERKRIEHNEGLVYRANAVSEAQIFSGQRVAEEQNGDPAGMTERVLSSYDDFTKAKIEGAPEKQRAQLKVEFAGMRSHVWSGAFAKEAGLRQAAGLANFESGVDADARAVLNDPWQFGDKLNRRESAASELQMPETVRTKQLQMAREKLVLAAATGYAQQYPRETLSALGQGGPHYDDATREKVLGAMARGESGVGFVPGMVKPGVFDSTESQQAFEDAKRPRAAISPALGMLPFERVDDIARIAHQTIERDVSTIRVTLQDRARDVQAAVGAGLPVGAADVAGMREQYDTAYGPVDGARRYQEQIGVALSVSNVLSRMRAASPQDRAAMIAAASVKGIDGAAEQSRVHEAAVKADEIVRQQLKTDPAGYALTTSPPVQAAYAQLSAANSPAEIIAANAAYASATRAEQERLGAPSTRLLTQAQSETYGRQFSEAQPADFVGMTSGLAMGWGKEWPAVYSQLAKEDKLPPAALVIPNMKDDGSKLRMAQAATLKPADLDAMIQPADKKDVRDQLQQQFAPLAQTMAAQSLGSARTLSTIMDQAEKLAIYYRGTGKSTADAARQAFDEAAGWKYEFFDTYRVPHEEQPLDIELGARVAIRDLGRVAMFDSPYPMGTDHRGRQSLDAIRTNAFWATNEDETGLVLKVKGLDNTDYTAHKEDGKRVEYKWQDLRLLASNEKPSAKPLTSEERNTKLKNTLDEQERMRRLRNER